MPWQALTFFVLFTALAVASSVRSLANLAPGVSLNEAFARGVFAGRRFFTPVGWRHRNRAILLQIVGFLGAVAVWYAIEPW